VNPLPKLKLDTSDMFEHHCKVCGCVFHNYKSRSPVCKNINCVVTWNRNKLEKIGRKK